MLYNIMEKLSVKKPEVDQENILLKKRKILEA